jgi:hypothetical protein
MVGKEGVEIHGQPYCFWWMQHKYSGGLRSGHNSLQYEIGRSGRDM